MRKAAYIGGLLGLVLLITLVVRADFLGMLQTFLSGGWPLLWLVPYRAVYFLLYAWGWLLLLGHQDGPNRVGLGYIFWVTSVREAIDRLLPVASVGGGVAAVRLLRWRGQAVAHVGASVVVEIVVTLVVAYLFTALGLLLWFELSAPAEEFRRFLLGFLLTLPVPVVMLLLLRYGAIFKRLHRFLGPLVGQQRMSAGAAALDHAIEASLRRGWRLLGVGMLQFIAVSSGAFEIWLALQLFSHPVGFTTALALESLTQAVRHLAFIVPAGLGVQEAGLVLFGHSLGISGELALAISMVKRMREVLCGLPSLISWQFVEGRRLALAASNPSP